LLLVTYRLALERLVPDHDFTVVPYDSFARERVERVSIDGDGCLLVGLKKDPLVVAGKRARKVVYCRVRRIEQRLLVVTLGVACSLAPEDDVISFECSQRESHLPLWVSEVDLRAAADQLVVQFSHQALKNSDELDSVFDFPP